MGAREATAPRASRPGRRIYSSVDSIPHVLQGLGICVLSTPAGLLSTREARAKHVGGELLTHVHGAPLRAVVPSRRGWFWVKWLTRIEVG